MKMVNYITELKIPYSSHSVVTYMILITKMIRSSNDFEEQGQDYNQSHIGPRSQSKNIKPCY